MMAPLQGLVHLSGIVYHGRCPWLMDFRPFRAKRVSNLDSRNLSGRLSCYVQKTTPPKRAPHKGEKTYCLSVFLTFQLSDYINLSHPLQGEGT